MGIRPDYCIAISPKIAIQESRQIPIHANANVNIHWKSSSGRIFTKNTVRSLEGILAQIPEAFVDPVH